ncbi:MAG: hypothetical protein LAP38_25070 [Acidobacteriia bacterium]|nr:hypothetical protein [Terriglobia bacterium]
MRMSQVRIEEAPASALGFSFWEPFYRGLLDDDKSPQTRFLKGAETMISKNDFDLFTVLVQKADEAFDGHLTVMKFTTNWRVGFATPSDRADTDDMSAGKTFAEAAQKALDRAGASGN